MSYVFLHLFPELSEGQEHVEQRFPGEEFISHHIYIMALVGLSFFYGLERSVVASKKEGLEKEGEKKPPARIFWVHIMSFGIYNALIGYILFQREEGPLTQLLLFSTAMALHFIVNDFGLHEHHQRRYSKYGRWLLVLALVAGWAVGYFIEVSETIIFLLIAFIGGGVIMNVLKEELPEDRESRYWAFALGAFLYAILLLSL